MKYRLFHFGGPPKFQKFRAWLIRLALGKRTYEYMRRSLERDPRLRGCKLADIVVRQDGRERRIEADWLRNLAKITLPPVPFGEVPPDAGPSECARADAGGPYAEAIPLGFNERSR